VEEGSDVRTHKSGVDFNYRALIEGLLDIVFFSAGDDDFDGRRLMTR